MDDTQLSPAMMSRQEYLELRVVELEQLNARQMSILNNAIQRLNRYAEICRLCRETFQHVDTALMNMADMKPSLVGIVNRERNCIHERIDEINRVTQGPKSYEKEN